MMVYTWERPNHDTLLLNIAKQVAGIVKLRGSVFPQEFERQVRDI